jgi:hypothetical protein
MKRSMWMLAAAAAVFAGGVAVQAGTAYDASVTAPPGWYNGSGNPNGGFTVVTDNGIEIGLRAKYRNNPSVINTPNTIYTVVPGAQTNVTSGGNGAAANRAAWNYEFSINLRPGGVGSLTLGDIDDNSTLKVTDLTTGANFTVNPLKHWPDNSSFGTVKNDPQILTDWGTQNSENPVFGDFPLNPSTVPGYTFDMNAQHNYQFDLSIFADGASVPLASDSIEVDVVPLPSAAWSGLGLMGLIGLVGGIKRYRRQHA